MSNGTRASPEEEEAGEEADEEEEEEADEEEELKAVNLKCLNRWAAKEKQTNKPRPDQRRGRERERGREAQGA